MVTILVKHVSFCRQENAISISDISTSVFCYYKTNAVGCQDFSFNWQTYLSSTGLDRNVSHSEAAPVEDSSSPRKFEYISFKGPVCHPSDSLLCKVPSNLLLPGQFSLHVKYVFLALHTNFSNFYVLMLFTQIQEQAIDFSLNWH